MESLPIPEDGWTYETILDKVRINVEKVDFPFTLNDLGDGFVPVDDKGIFTVFASTENYSFIFQGKNKIVTTIRMACQYKSDDVKEE